MSSAGRKEEIPSEKSNSLILQVSSAGRKEEIPSKKSNSLILQVSSAGRKEEIPSKKGKSHVLQVSSAGRKEEIPSKKNKSHVLHKAKDGFVKRAIAGESLLVPVGNATKDFNGMVMLNETGDYLWDLLVTAQTKESLIQAMTKEFDATEEILSADVAEFIEHGLREGLIVEM